MEQLKVRLVGINIKSMRTLRIEQRIQFLPDNACSLLLEGGTAYQAGGKSRLGILKQNLDQKPYSDGGIL